VSNRSGVSSWNAGVEPAALTGLSYCRKRASIQFDLALHEHNVEVTTTTFVGSWNFRATVEPRVPPINSDTTDSLPSTRVWVLCRRMTLALAVSWDGGKSVPV